MQVLALADGLHHLSDIDAVLDHGVARLVVLERELVPDRDVALRRDLDVLVVFHDPAPERLAGPDAFDDDYADAVAFLMDHEMNHRGVILFACTGEKMRAAASCCRSAPWPLPRACARSRNSPSIRSASASPRATRPRRASCCGRG